MKNISFLLFSCLIFSSAFAQQYYLRGEVKDENNNSLGNAKILLHSTNYLYYSDTSGVFEILINEASDSVTISADGFKPLSMGLEAGQYQYIILNALNSTRVADNRRLSCITKNMHLSPSKAVSDANGTIRSFVENPFVEAEQYPETIFAVNPDKISYNNFQRYININSVVPPDALRIEELINYFNLDYKEPPADSNFLFSSYLTQCPWNEKNQLLFLHANAKKNDFDKVPPTNLVFLIDASGSMDLPNKLPLLKSALRFLVNNLREKDTISIVTYGKATSVWLPPTPGSFKKPILKAIEQLKAGGSLPGDIAIRNAYTIAENQFIKEGSNRVILITDGDFNSGQSTQEELEKMIMMHKRWGIYLTCIGIGMGDTKDERLQVLAERGSGNMSYIDDQKSAEKALMREFAQVVYTVADSAYFNIQLDSNLVKNYRVVGFENNVNSIRDTANEIRAGEVGSGNSIMAMVEITPAPDSVRKLLLGASIGNIELHYKSSGDTAHKFSSYELPGKISKFSSLPAPYRFASSIAWCGSLMKNSSLLNNTNWSDAISLAKDSYNNKDVAQKDFIEMIQKAKKIYLK
ncbi:MAG TPA: von Willebrand factor type A domain-containing protein [Puia sp.]|nr:von Willebrand factor type A domain-containing protein [Puia sp.]